MNRIAALLLALSTVGGFAWIGIRDASLILLAGPAGLASLAAARGLWLARPWGYRWTLGLGAIALILQPLCAPTFYLPGLLAAPWSKGRWAPIVFLGDAVRCGAVFAAIAAVAFCFVARPTPRDAISAPFHPIVIPIERFDLVDCGGRIRRVVGLPGETIRVDGGEVYLERGGTWVLARKSVATQRRMWRPAGEPDPLSSREAFSAVWRSEGDPPCQFRVEDRRLSTVEKDGTRRSRFVRVGTGDDVRVDMAVTALGHHGEIFVEVAHRRGTFVARLSTHGKSSLEYRGKSRDFQLPMPEVSLDRGRRHRVELWVYDAQAAVRWDGVVSQVLEVPDDNPLGGEGPFAIAFGAVDLLLHVDDLALSEDLMIERPAGVGSAVTVLPASYAVVPDAGGSPAHPLLIGRECIRGRIFLRLSPTPPHIRPAR